MSYKVTIPRTRKPAFKKHRYPARENDEQLTGYVQGKKASDIEERFARAIRKMHLRFFFNYIIYTAVTIPGYENKVDFLVEHNGLWMAFEIDGEIGHKTSTQKRDDIERDVLVNEALMRIGVRPIVRIPWTKLETQEQADRTLREVLRV